MSSLSRLALEALSTRAVGPGRTAKPIAFLVRSAVGGTLKVRAHFVRGGTEHTVLVERVRCGVSRVQAHLRVPQQLFSVP